MPLYHQIALFVKNEKENIIQLQILPWFLSSIGGLSLTHARTQATTSWLSSCETTESVIIQAVDNRGWRCIRFWWSSLSGRLRTYFFSRFWCRFILLRRGTDEGKSENDSDVEGDDDDEHQRNVMTPTSLTQHISPKSPWTPITTVIHSATISIPTSHLPTHWTFHTYQRICRVIKCRTHPQVNALFTVIGEAREELWYRKFKPTYGSVQLQNGGLATVPVFDMKTMILLLHDKTLMQNHNFAPGLDIIFTGNLNDDCYENNTFGEIHTGDAWNQAVHRFGGEGNKYMPLGLFVLGNNSHMDQHGTLLCSPVTFTATFFNSAVRNNPDCWRPMGYIPNLAHSGVGGGKAVDKSQNEHNCLSYVLKSYWLNYLNLGAYRRL